MNAWQCGERDSLGNEDHAACELNDSEGGPLDCPQAEGRRKTRFIGWPQHGHRGDPLVSIEEDLDSSRAFSNNGMPV